MGKNNGLLDVSCARSTDKTVLLAKGNLSIKGKLLSAGMLEVLSQYD